MYIVTVAASGVNGLSTGPELVVNVKFTNRAGNKNNLKKNVKIFGRLKYCYNFALLLIIKFISYGLQKTIIEFQQC